MKNLRTLCGGFFVMKYFVSGNAPKRISLNLRFKILEATKRMWVILTELHPETVPDITNTVTVFFYKGYIPGGLAYRKQWLGSAERTHEGAAVRLSMQHKDVDDLLMTLAHELVHVHQISRGVAYQMTEVDREAEANFFMLPVVSRFKGMFPELYQVLSGKLCL